MDVACTVDQHLDGAHLGGQGVDPLPLADIQRVAHDPRVGLGKLLEQFRVDVRGHDLGPLSGKGERDGSAYALPRRGEQRLLASQSIHKASRGGNEVIAERCGGDWRSQGVGLPKIGSMSPFKYPIAKVCPTMP